MSMDFRLNSETPHQDLKDMVRQYNRIVAICTTFTDATMIKDQYDIASKGHYMYILRTQ